ncbi:LacI family DNA-binding transcriptional regulator [Paenibacillus aurantius]|uniref:LacI family DNA-binding transcriptional regulator n=1 Tax=Paenibacillus aurantius TaxID=2918900 RepID=A0AA96LDJ4_9BACL|nr:LacI family DNA-binding transcriptional regulator [Paenibacillus aurantius]WNQ12024.1 LacI family DNA-binding transcriptional regulator [Paenibacillus aurantius]
MANIKDIAKHLGISVSTVSRAMNDHPDVSEETKSNVMQAVRALNYRPNALAKGLIQKKTFTIGLMIPDIADPFFSELGDAVESKLFEHGYQVIYGNTKRNPAKEKQFLMTAMERQYDGLILTPDHLDEEFVDLLTNLPMPAVFLRRRTPPGLSMPFIDVDHHRAALDAMDHLIGLGHRHIGFIGMPDNSFIGNERLRGYRERMELSRLPCDPTHVETGGRSIRDGREAMERLYARHSELTAVFAANDLLGIGALEWLARRQIPVPQRVSVIGFDNLNLAELHWIQLTTMEQPRPRMGSRAAELLLRMMEDKALNPEPELFDTKLIIRGSCASASGNA